MPVVAIATNEASTSLGPAALALALVGFVALCAAQGRVRGTTLTAAWYWAGWSLGCLTAAELAAAWWASPASPTAIGAWRFAAAVTTFCPAMAVFGAKRPQHVAWQFIVLSLWCVLVLPAGEALLYGRSGLEVDVVRSWFLLILMGMALANWLPTRYWACALLVALGQLVLLGEFLPLPAVHFGPVTSIVGIALLIAGGVLFALRRPPARGDASTARMWRDFCDLYGAAWGLRVAQRVNDTAHTQGWPLALTWHGLVANKAGVSPESRAAIENSLTMLLRRFVSTDWIAAHGGSAGNVPLE